MEFEERDPIFEEEKQTELIEQIQNAPDCIVFGVNRFNQRTIRILMVFDVVVAIILAALVLSYDQSDTGAL
ncbi:hypothetical protein EU528_14155, partial [Candidatus Thorarchaeota archaeon]